MDHDIMRSLKGGKPFLLMEQAPSQVNWRRVNRAKASGMMKLYSYQALAHGADGLMFFQWRQSRRGSEKFHSACVTHTGDEHSRVFREVADLGSDLNRYKMIVAPFLYMLSREAGDRFRDYVERGGRLVVGCGSGIVDEEEAVFEEGYPGPLSGTLGIRVEESDPLYPGQSVRISFEGREGKPDAAGDLWEDRIHTAGAETVAWFSEGMMKGFPALTRNKLGEGEAWYLGLRPDKETMARVFEGICTPGGRGPAGTLLTAALVRPVPLRRSGMPFREAVFFSSPGRGF